MRIRGGVVLGLLLMASPAHGQTPRLVSDVDTTMVSVGDRITLQVTVEHSPTSTVVWPDSLNLEPFEVLGGRATSPVAQGEVARSSLALNLAAFELGDLEIPSFQVEVVSEDGESTTLLTNPFGIRVSSVGLDEGGDIRELKGPLGIPVGLGRVLLVALVALLALAAAYVIFRRIRRGDPESATAIPSLPSRPPHEVALEAFARLEASPLLERGEIKDFHIQVSEILRVYVEGRFRVPALEMTTVDITSGLERKGLELPVVQEFRSFLHSCDMVKFAKNRPSADESLSRLKLGRKLVEETFQARPQPSEDPSQTPSSSEESLADAPQETSDKNREEDPGKDPKEGLEEAPGTDPQEAGA